MGDPTFVREEDQIGRRERHQRAQSLPRRAPSRFYRPRPPPRLPPDTTDREILKVDLRHVASAGRDRVRGGGLEGTVLRGVARAIGEDGLRAGVLVAPQEVSGNRAMVYAPPHGDQLRGTARLACGRSS